MSSKLVKVVHHAYHMTLHYADGKIDRIPTVDATIQTHYCDDIEGQGVPEDLPCRFVDLSELLEVYADQWATLKDG